MTGLRGKRPFMLTFFPISYALGILIDSCQTLRSATLSRKQPALMTGWAVTEVSQLLWILMTPWRGSVAKTSTLQPQLRGAAASVSEVSRPVTLVWTDIKGGKLGFSQDELNNLQMTSPTATWRLTQSLVESCPQLNQGKEDYGFQWGNRLWRTDWACIYAKPTNRFVVLFHFVLAVLQTEPRICAC